MPNVARVRLFQLSLTAIAVLASSTYARAATVVACVGDSITAGYNLSGNQSYPSQLGSMLGSAYVVKNYGVSGTTMLKNGNSPYWGTSAYSSSLTSSPNYVLIQFGTNDSKPSNWNAHGSEFVGDYESMIATYQGLSTQPTVMPCFITPYFLPNPWPTDFPDPSRIPNLIEPAIQQVITDTASPSIDNYTPFVGQSQWFGDGIHPTVDGAHILARNAYNAVTGANLTVLTGVNINDGGGSSGGNPATAAFDINSTTYYDATRATGAWTGIDLGSANTKTLRMISYTPRSGRETRMVGGIFQASNDLINWTTLGTVSSRPADTYSVIPVNGAPLYRYLRYYSAGSNSHGNVAEVEFLGN